MDTVTHALVGAAISDCWLRKRLGPVATPFALAVAALPDVDAVTYLISTATALANHRGYTHSLLPMMLAAPLLGLAGWTLSGRRGEKRGRWTQWWLLAALCLLSHTLFDLMTSWGTMPLLPFSNARLSWDILPIIDAFLLAVTGGSFVANRILRWERVDTFINPLVYPVVHRHPGRQKAGDWIGKITVCLVAVYLLIGWQQNRQTVRIAAEALAAQGVTPVEVRALPLLLTYIAYDIAARDASGTVYNSAYSSYAPAGNAPDEPVRLHFKAYPTLPPEEAAEELSSPEGRFFAWYTQGMFVASRAGDVFSDSDGEGIVLRDRRFFRLTNPDASRFEATFLRDADGKLIGAGVYQHGYGAMNLRAEFECLRELTWEGTGAGFDAEFDAPATDAGAE